jgi:hypothetical protein
MEKNIENLKLSEIRRDGDTQPRSNLNEEVVVDYAERMMAGAEFPPVIVVRDDCNYWLVDGFHRVEAAQRAGRSDITCEVRYGTKEDAQWLSLASNATHGERRSRADTSRAVDLALKHGHAAKLSDPQIAEHVGVSASTVLRRRRKLESTCALHKLPERLGKDGRLRKLPKSNTLEEPAYAESLRRLAAERLHPPSGNDLKLPPLEHGMEYLAVGRVPLPALVFPAPEGPGGWHVYARLHNHSYHTLHVLNEDFVRHFLNDLPFLGIEEWNARPWDGTLPDFFPSREERWVEDSLHSKFYADHGRFPMDGECDSAWKVIENIEGNETESQYVRRMLHIRDIKWT